MSKSKSAFYSGAGPVLTHYEMDVENCTLARKADLTLPNNVQYAWPHSEKPILYVGASSRVHRDQVGSDHSVCALQIAADGSLSMLGERLQLPGRPVNVTCDPPTRHLLITCNKPSALWIVRIKEDGSLGGIVEQRPDVDAGTYPHQVRVTPDNRHCITVARGNPFHKGWWSYKGKQKDPGALKVFEYKDGVLGKQTSLTLGDGLEFGPRHLDFHPSAPWVYLNLETQNDIVVFRRDENGIQPEPVQRFSSLIDPEDILVHQGLGTVHVHPKGHVVYFANRGSQPMPYKDGEIVTGVDNTFVVCAIDQNTGKLNIIQRIDSGGICARTFGLDPSGRMLVAANSVTRWVKEGKELRNMPANLSTFKVLDDGRLEFRNRYDAGIPPNKKIIWGGVATY